MKKIIIALLLFLLIVVLGCRQVQQKSEPFCGDDICQPKEKESGCAADCSGFEGITKLQCTQAGGNWNECGSPCTGTGAQFCIQVCSPQCQCNGAAGFKCPLGYKCRLTGKISEEVGVCVKQK